MNQITVKFEIEVTLFMFYNIYINNMRILNYVPVLAPVTIKRLSLKYSSILERCCAILLDGIFTI